MAAAVGLPLALLFAVGGQALGSMIGGCSWIGVSTPIHLQPWALVNQPTLAFSSRPEALGYWLGSLLVPLVIALATIPLAPRPRTLAAELLTVQIAWGATTIGLAWLPLIDLEDGHLGRWLQLTNRPVELVWVVVLVAAAAAVSPTFRLLALVRSVRPHAGRRLRLGAVALHFGVPVGTWVIAAWCFLGGPPIAAIVALVVPLAIGLAIAFAGYPAPYPHRLAGLGMPSAARLVMTAVVLGALLWLAGRPLAGGRCAGLLWKEPGSFNNIRPWIEPATIPLPWTGRSPAGRASQPP